MAKLNYTQLAKSTRDKIQSALELNPLPKRLPWPKGVKAKDLAKTGSYADRFNDGAFSVTQNGKTFTITGGVSARGATIGWELTVDEQTGVVEAVPHIDASGGPNRDIAFKSRTVMTLGKLLPLIPASFVAGLTEKDDPDLIEDFAVKARYGDVDAVVQARTTLANALLASIA